MQNIINNKKIQNINRFFISSEKKVFISLGIFILLLVLSYAFLVFSSVSTVYALDQGEEYLASITSDNSVLESEFSVKKEKVSSKFKTRLVEVHEVAYIDSSFERLVMNR